MLAGKDADDPTSAHLEEGVRIKPITVGQWDKPCKLPLPVTDAAPELELDEEGTRISLTIVDTPGFGDQIDNEARYVHLDMPISQPLLMIERLASRKSWDTSSVNTTTSLQKSLVLSVTLASETTAYTHSSTSLHPPAMGTTNPPSRHLQKLTFETASANSTSSS